MKAPFLAIALALVGVLAGFSADAQTPNPTPPGGDENITPNRAVGELKVIDAAARQLIIKTDAGSLVTVVLNDSTAYMRVAPGEKSLTNATKITFADLAEGDRVAAMGKVADDHKMEEARCTRHYHGPQARDQRDHHLESDDGRPTATDHSCFGQSRDASLCAGFD